MMISIVKCEESTDEGKKLAKRLRSLICDYERRWWALLGPVIVLVAIGGAIILAPLASSNERRDKLLFVGGLALVLVAWGVVAWLMPTLRYRKYRKQGLIVEIHDEMTAEFLNKFAAEVETRQRAIATAAHGALNVALLKIAALDLSTVSGQHLRNTYLATLLDAPWATTGPDEEHPIQF